LTNLDKCYTQEVTMVKIFFYSQLLKGPWDGHVLYYAHYAQHITVSIDGTQVESVNIYR